MQHCIPCHAMHVLHHDNERSICKERAEDEEALKEKGEQEMQRMQEEMHLSQQQVHQLQEATEKEREELGKEVHELQVKCEGMLNEKSAQDERWTEKVNMARSEGYQKAKQELSDKEVEVMAREAAV